MKKLIQILFVSLVVGMVQSASALIYSSSDLLLVFHQGGNNDVVYDIGPVGNYKGLTAGTVVPVSYDVNLVTTNFGNTLGGVQFAVVGATASTDNPLRYWVSDPDLSDVPSDVTLSKFSTVRGKIQSVGTAATTITGGTNASPLVIDPTDPNAYSYIVSDGSQSAISTFDGNVDFAIDGSDNTTVDLYEVQPSATTPKPAATLIGSFTMLANGVMYFTAGATPTGIVLSPSSISSGGSATLSIAVPAPGYQWFHNGVAISGATNSTLTVTNANPTSDAGPYTVQLDGTTFNQMTLVVNYASTDLLLVFRQSGYNDVEYDIGSVSNYLGLTAGTVVPVSYDVNLVTTNFNNTLANVLFGVVGATASTDGSLRYWASDADLSSAPTDVTLSKFSTARGKIQNAGTQLTTITGGNGTPLVIVSTDPNAYSYIVSDGSQSAISTFDGNVDFPVDNVNPAALALYQIQPSATNPKPAATLIGTFTMQSNGTLTFTAGTTIPFDVAPATLPDGTYNTPYTQTLSVVEANIGTCTFAVTSGTLPTGFTLSSDGTLSGTPFVGTNTFTVTVTPTSAVGVSPVNKTYTLAVTGLVAKAIGKLAVAQKPGALFSNVFTVTGTYTPGVTKTKVAVPAIVYYSFDGASFQQANTADSFANWSATLPAAALGTHTFAAYAQDDTGLTTPTITTTNYTFGVTSTFTLTQVGQGGIKGKATKTGTTPTTTGPGTNLATLYMPAPVLYNIKATSAPHWLFSNYVVTVDAIYGLAPTNVLPNAKFDYTFDMKTNMAITANFVTNRYDQTAVGTYWGLFSDTAPAFESAGLIKLTTKAGTKTGKQTVSGIIYPQGQKVGFTASMDLDGNGTSAATVAKAPVTDTYVVSVNMDLAGGMVATGTVHAVTAGWTSAFTAYRSPYGDPTKGFEGAPPSAGQYTMVITNSSNPTEPGGYGYGLFTIGLKNWNVKGRMGDYYRFATASGLNVATNGMWPFYAGLYADPTKAYHGMAMGWMTFTNGTDLEGTLTWIKQSGSGQPYDAGFTNDFAIAASPFTNTAACLDFDPGHVVVSGGDAPSIDQLFANTPPSANTPSFLKNTKTATNNFNNVSLKLKTTVGNANGKFYSDLTKTVGFLFDGAVLQNANIAYGAQELGTGATATGPVVIKP